MTNTRIILYPLEIMQSIPRKNSNASNVGLISPRLVALVVVTFGFLSQKLWEVVGLPMILLHSMNAV